MAIHKPGAVMRAPAYRIYTDNETGDVVVERYQPRAQQPDGELVFQGDGANRLTEELDVFYDRFGCNDEALDGAVWRHCDELFTKHGDRATVSE